MGKGPTYRYIFATSDRQRPECVATGATDRPTRRAVPGKMQCAPTFGAVPSAADLKKKQEEAAMVEEKRDEILMQLMNKEVAMRLNAMEVDNPAKVQSSAELASEHEVYTNTHRCPASGFPRSRSNPGAAGSLAIEWPFQRAEPRRIAEEHGGKYQHPLLAHLLVPLTSCLRAGDH